MKKILRIIGLAMGSITLLIGGVVAFAGITGQFNSKPIEIETLSFAHTNFLEIDNFNANITYFPTTANNLEVNLRIVKGAAAVEVPATVKANEPFQVTIKKDANGNNVGGEVEISASTKLAVSTSNMRFWVDIAIPQNGLIIASDKDTSGLIAGDAAFNVFVFTNPRLALYPDSKPANTDFFETYKDIKLTSSDPNALTILNGGVGTKRVVYYNAGHTTNGQPMVSLTRTAYNNIETHAYVYSVRPITSGDSGITLTASALRTYSMQDDFVDVAAAKYAGNIDQAFADFSAYINKYKHYIMTDTRTFTVKNSSGEDVVVYENGEDFITKNTIGNAVVINRNADAPYQAALHYLHVNTTQNFSIEDITINGVTATSQKIDFPLFKEEHFNTSDLISTFGLNVFAQAGTTFPESLKPAVIRNTTISVLTGIDENGDGELDRGIDLDGDGLITGDEENELILVKNNELFRITNPAGQPKPDPLNPIWTIQSLNPQDNDNLLLWFEFEILNNAVKYTARVAVQIIISEVERLTLNPLPHMAINSTLEAGRVEVKSYALTSNYYSLQNKNATYRTVKFFATKNSARTEAGFPVLRYSQTFDMKLLTMKHWRNSSSIVEAYEIAYNDGTNVVMQAINATARDVEVFAAIVKTDYLGEPILDENDNYIIIERSDVQKFNVTAFIDKLNFYTFDAQNQIYIKRTSEAGNDEIVLLSDHDYEIYVTNLELKDDGTFNGEYSGYTNKEFIDHSGNLTFALRKDAYGTSEIPSNDITFNTDLFSTAGDDDALRIVRDQDRDTYSYDPSTNLITIKIRVSSRSSIIPTITNDVLPAFSYNLYPSYTTGQRPVDLEKTSKIGLKVVFANILNNIEIVNTSNVTAGEIEVTASASEGSIQWLYNVAGGSGQFNIAGVDYSFDIATIINDIYNSKIDIAFQNDIFLLGGYKQVAQGVGNYIRVPEEYEEVDAGEGDYDLVAGEYILVGAGNGRFIRKPERYELVGAGNGDYILGSGYLQNLRDNTKITWSSSKPDFVRVMVNPDGTLDFAILKGTTEGELVNITVTLETYPDEKGNYLQRKSSTITLRVKQENPVAKLYSYSETVEYGRHLVVNSGERAHVIDGGVAVDLLQKLDTNLPVYKVDNAGQLVATEETSNVLIDVLFNDSNASIIGDLEFKINDENTQTIPSIYFLNVNGEKVYTTRATRIVEGSTVRYELFVYSETKTTDSVEAIGITNSQGIIFDSYNIKVLSNVSITIPQGANLSVIDSLQLDFKNHFTAIQEKQEGNLNLPFSFELVGDASKNYSQLLVGASKTFTVGQTLPGAAINENYAYVVGENGFETTQFATILSPFRVSNNKEITIKLYYYVPKTDNSGNPIMITVDHKQLYLVDGVYKLRTPILNEQGDPVLDENGEPAYNEVTYGGSRFYVFEKREYEYNSELGKIIIKPTYTIKTGANIPSEIQVDSGTQHNLFEVVMNGNGTSTNFINVLQRNTKDDFTDATLVLPNNMAVAGGTTFDYGEVYREFMNVSFDTSNLSEEQLTIFNLLAPSLVNGVITSNSINSDLVVPLRIVMREGKLVDGLPMFTEGGLAITSVKIKFKNSVTYSVNTAIEVEGSAYSTSQNTQTNGEIGHVYSGANTISAKTLVVGQKSVSLYKNTNPVAQNFIKLTGGSGEDLISSHLTGINLYYYNNAAGYSLYVTDIPVVEVIRNTAAGKTTEVLLNFNRAVNEDTHFRIDFNSSSFDELLGSYYFTVKKSVTLSVNYPIRNDASYSDHNEMVVSNTSVNMFEGYVNPNSRIQIEIDEHVYELHEVAGAFKLININNIADVITVTNASGTTSGIVFFKYYLLNGSKAQLTSAPEVDSVNGAFPRSITTNYSNAVIKFNTISQTKVYYLRVELFNGVFVDYKFNLQTTVSKENFTITQGSTSSSPIDVTATENFDLYSKINGDNGTLIVKYKNTQIPANLKVGGVDGGSISIYTKILKGNIVIFEDVKEATLVEFWVYGSRYVSGDLPKVMYVRIVPNFTVEKLTNFIAAGTTVPLENIFELGGNANSGVSYAITKIGTSDYTAENSYGIKLESGNFISQNISQTIDLTFTVTKDFGEGKVYVVPINGIQLMPNAKFVTKYNMGTFEEVEAPAVGAPKLHVITNRNNDAVSLITVKNYAGENLTNVIYEVYDTNNVLISNLIETDTSEVQDIISFVVLSTNKVVIYKLRVIVEWDNDTRLALNYEIRVKPNLSAVVTTYVGTQTDGVRVNAGATYELDFSGVGALIAANGTSVTAYATQNGGVGNLNIILGESTSENYWFSTQIVGEVTKYFITFNDLSSTNIVVSLNIYLDLVGSVGAVASLSQLNDILNISTLGKTDKIKFTIMPSAQAFTVKDEYKDYNTPSGALAVDFYSPQLIEYENGPYNAGGQFVGMGNGTHNYALNSEDYRYTFVGAGNGNYNYVLQDEEFVYNKVNNGTGSYALLAPNQYDLFEVVNLELKAGLEFVGVNGGIINKEVVRNSLKYEVVTPDTEFAVDITNGIATFLPTSLQQTIGIKISLYNSTSASTFTIYFSLAAGVGIFTENNEYVADMNSEGVYNFKVYDVVNYGRIINSYSGESADNEIYTVNDPDNIVMFVSTPSINTKYSTVLLLNNTLLSYTIGDGSELVESFVNGIITFKNGATGTVKVDVQHGIETSYSFYVIVV